MSRRGASARLGTSLFLLLISVVTRADLTADQTKEAQALIKQFTSQEFALRQQAVQKLVEMRPIVLPLVQKTLAETDDNEVKLRCEMVIKGIGEKPIQNVVPKGVQQEQVEPERKSATLRGRIVDADGKPIGGATVQALEYVPGSTGGELKLMWQGMTPADGTFSIEAPVEVEVMQIVARKEGLALGFDSWVPKRGEPYLQIKLGKATVLGGTVVDEAGRPIAGAEVHPGFESVNPYMFESSWHWTSSSGLDWLGVKTDREGRFSFSNIPADFGVYLHVEASGRATVTTKRGQSELYPPGKDDIRIVLPAEAVIQGIVVDELTDKPVPGVGLHVHSPQGSQCVLAKDGTFEARGLVAGIWYVGVFSLEGTAEWVAELVEVTAEAGKTTRGVTIRVTKGGILEVVVKDSATGRRLEGECVSVSQADKPNLYFAGLTDREGVARIRVLPGQCDAQTSHRMMIFQRPGQSAWVGEGDTARVELRIKAPRRITGVVRDEAGRPVEGAEVLVVLLGEGVHRTGPDGKFQVTWDPDTGLQEGVPACILARHTGRNLAAMLEIAEGTHQADVRLIPAGMLVGQVLDSNGKPIRRAAITVGMPYRVFPGAPDFVEHVRSEPCMTDEEGRYQLKALPYDRNYRIGAVANGYGPGKEVRVLLARAQGGRFEVDGIVLRRASLSISGVVVDENDMPVAYVWVSTGGDNQPNNQTRTDAAGKFSIEKMCEGPVKVSSSCRIEGRTLIGGVQAQGGDKDVRIVVKKPGQ